MGCCFFPTESFRLSLIELLDSRLWTLPPGLSLNPFSMPASSFVPGPEFRHQNQSTVSIWAPGQNSAEAMRRRLPVTRVSFTALGRSMRF